MCWSRKLLSLSALALSSVVLASCAHPPSPQGSDEQLRSAWPEPAATRPVVDLEFRVDPDLKSVIGTERIAFTPDLGICELVFRAWPNKPATAWSGSSLVVTSVQVDGQSIEPKVSPAGAPKGVPGTLVEVPLPSCVSAGTTVEAELGFTVELGVGTDERVGTSPSSELAWFGTAYPLLAWVNGVGWARDEAVRVVGETVVSETFRLASLRVIAPEEYEVLGAGEKQGATADRDSGLTTHEFAAPAVRDVTVTVGRIDIIEQQVGDAVIYVGGPEDRMNWSLEDWADAVAESVTRVSEYLGPVPNDEIWVSVIPDQTDGIEFPGAMQLGQLSLKDDVWLVTHEVAHLWFYGLVGNNQATDPWMDESFASFVQQVADHPDLDPQSQHDYPDSLAEEVGLSMSDWYDYRHPDDAYIAAVYGAGSDMLVEARREAGPKAFDAALRAYLRDNAHQVATPDDIEVAFSDVPEVLKRMRAAGALD